jgi:probable F420-dependent oxidoreductase
LRTGIVFPQKEIGDDPVLIRDFAQSAEGLGYTHLLVFDHVVGAGRAHRPEWRGPYDVDDAFHEPFVLFGYLAGLTERIELVTDVLVLPQRQTVLVAKQAAELDVVSGGRLRLGVGIGWNDVEYAALGENFHDRGRRIEEQIALLRALWTQRVVDFEGRWHHVPEAGIKPLPVQGPFRCVGRPALFG